MTQYETGTDLRFQLGRGCAVRIQCSDELGPDALGRLIKLLEGQRSVLLPPEPAPADLIGGISWD
jgi:hypothetical protein